MKRVPNRSGSFAEHEMQLHVTVGSCRSRSKQDLSVTERGHDEQPEISNSHNIRNNHEAEVQVLAKNLYLPRLNKLRMICKKAWLVDKERKKMIDSSASIVMNIRRIIERCQKKIDPHIPVLPEMAKQICALLRAIPPLFTSGASVTATIKNKTRKGRVKKKMETNPRCR